MKCLFLGYSDKKTKIIKFLEEKKIRVKQIHNNLSEKDAAEADIIISFGFNKLIKKELIDKFKRPAINLHMSFLPYNRGSYPNFWSFVNDTPKGVTIHEIDEGADTGNIIYQNRYDLNANLEKFSTFKKSYDFLFSELENLFIEKYEEIINYKYQSKKQVGKFSINKDTDLPNNINDWNINILDYLKKIKK